MSTITPMPSDQDFDDWLHSLVPEVVVEQWQRRILTRELGIEPPVASQPSEPIITNSLAIAPAGITIGRALAIACQVYDAKVARGRRPNW